MYNNEFAYIMDYAKDKVDDIEILLSADDSFSVRISLQKVESFNYSDAKGIGIRIIKDGKVGYAYTERFDDEAFKFMVDEAIANSEISESDEVIVLADYPDVEEKPDVYSEALDEVAVDEKVEYTKLLERSAKDADPRIVNVPYAVMGNGKTYLKIENSKGLSKEDIQNYAFSYVGALAATEDDKRMAFEFNIGRDFSKFDAEKLAALCVNNSLELLGGEQLESGSYPVVFNSKMMSTMLSTFSNIFSAKAVQEGKSLLLNKLGTDIANKNVNLIDDALHKDGFSTRAFDSEGYPSQRIVLIEKGQLKSLLHNTVTAAKDNVKSTGHGTRGYKGTLEISPTNFYLEPGDINREELFKKYDTVVEIVSLQGMHSGANPISGDFSLSGEGFLYKNGIKQHSLKPFTVSGNFINMLMDVEAIADDFKFDMSSIGSASTLIKNLSFSS